LDGKGHIDAAGYQSFFPKIKYANQWYEDLNIAICRLTDDFEQKIMYVEDDAYSGRLAHDDNDDGSYADYTRGVGDVYGYMIKNTYPYYILYSSGLARFLISHNNPDNNDDIDGKSEISNIKKSTVPNFEVTLCPEGRNLWLKVKKMTYN